MKDDFRFIIGLMSGTSLDGLDIVYVRFTAQHTSDFKILYGETIPYTSEWIANLQQAITFSDAKLNRLDTAYGALLGELTLNFIAKYQIERVDFIASHGHTVFHEPDKGLTFQMGNGAILSKTTGQKVICDFRTQDVQLGGQGAPLVPIGDALLFGNYDYCLNLGGFANISMDNKEQRIAYDICPVNIVLNQYVRQMDLPYDDGGKIAATGNVDVKLLNALNALPFYKLDYPKSLGLEWVQQYVFPLIDSYVLPIPDVLRTFTEHVAIQISSQLPKSNQTLLISGGGVYHTFLIDRIRQLTTVVVCIPSSEIIEYKEALIFAFLGLLRDQNKINVLASVTGAEKDHSSGKIYTEM